MNNTRVLKMNRGVWNDFEEKRRSYQALQSVNRKIFKTVSGNMVKEEIMLGMRRRRRR